MDDPGTTKGEEVEQPEGFFDNSFLEELESLAGGAIRAEAAGRPSLVTLPEKLQAFLTLPPVCPLTSPLDEEGFVCLPSLWLTDRINTLLEIVRQSLRPEAARAIENFIVFFRALIPTLSEDGSHAIRRVFFRVVPTLIHIAYNDFSDQETKRAEGLQALHSLERVLLEIANVKLAPTESELVFRSIDQMVGFIGVAEYAMASDLISSQLLSIISRNRLTRALYRLMEVEVGLQRFLKEKMGYPTPQVRLPEDKAVLSEYGPIRVFDEPFLDGVSRTLIQLHVPNVPSLRDVVLHLVSHETMRDHALRLDRLGSAELHVPPGTYAIGLAYEPESE